MSGPSLPPSLHTYVLASQHIESKGGGVTYYLLYQCLNCFKQFAAMHVGGVDATVNLPGLTLDFEPCPGLLPAPAYPPPLKQLLRPERLAWETLHPGTPYIDF